MRLGALECWTLGCLLSRPMYHLHYPGTAENNIQSTDDRSGWRSSGNSASTLLLLGSPVLFQRVPGPDTEPPLLPLLATVPFLEGTKMKGASLPPPRPTVSDSLAFLILHPSPSSAGRSC